MTTFIQAIALAILIAIIILIVKWQVDNDRWKPKYNERYYSVSWLGRVMSNKWYGTCDDELSYQFGNIFKTCKEAELVRDKIKKLLNQ